LISRNNLIADRRESSGLAIGQVLPIPSRARPASDGNSDAAKRTCGNELPARQSLCPLVGFAFHRHPAD
jgi:hypothetical protein